MKNEDTVGIVKNIWSNVLELPLHNIGSDDNIAALGGNSLRSILIFQKLAESGYPLPPAEYFRLNTVREIVALIESSKDSKSDHLDDVIDEGQSKSVTPGQAWYLSENFKEWQRYNLSTVYKVSKEINLESLKKAAFITMNHHESLRLRFFLETSWLSDVSSLEPEEVPFHSVDLSEFPSGFRQEIFTGIAEKIQSSLDPAKGRLLRIVYFKMGCESSDLVLFVIHHLPTDGYSQSLIRRDLWNTYAQLEAKVPVSLARKTASVTMISKTFSEFAHSKQAINDCEKILEMPWKSLAKIELPKKITGTDINAVASNKRLRGSFSKMETGLLIKELSLKTECSLADILYVSYAKAIAEWQRHDYVKLLIVSSARAFIFSRMNLDVSRSVANLAISVPIIFKIDRENTLINNLVELKPALSFLNSTAPSYEYCYWLRDDKGGLPDIPNDTKFVFNFLGNLDDFYVKEEEPYVEVQKISAGASQPSTNSRACIFYTVCYIADGHLEIEWNYSSDHFDADTALKVFDNFMNLLKKNVTPE